jgi:hypothetical protein
MRNIALVLLAVAVGVLILLVYSQTSVVREQQRQIDKLSDGLESVSKATSIDLQSKCAKQAQEAFKRDGFEGEKGASFSNHYNQKLNKCFVQVESVDWKTAPGTVFTNKVLSDAFEGKVYAEYMWRSDKVKKYWEVPPLRCSVTLLSGEEKDCHSSDEFDRQVKAYME